MKFLEISDAHPKETPSDTDDVHDEIPRIPCTDLTYNDFFHRFMVPNRPVILTGLADNWECFRNWAGRDHDHVDMEYLSAKFRGQEVPVADCGRSAEYNAHLKLSMQFGEFAQYWKERRSDDGHNVDRRLLYLKDWHLRKSKPDYAFYETPLFFGSDWLNEHLVSTDADDYMFVYIGPQGTW